MRKSRRHSAAVQAVKGFQATPSRTGDRRPNHTLSRLVLAGEKLGNALAVKTDVH